VRTHPRQLFATIATLAATAATAFTLAAFAAPAPRIRAHDGAAHGALRASPSHAEAATALERACATDVDALPRMLLDRVAASAQDPLPAPHSGDTGGLAVLEDDGSFFYTNSGGRTLLDIAAVARAFYRTHDDDEDFLAIYLASGQNQWLGSPGALAAAWMVRNDTQGLGLNTFDLGASFGSPARLKSVLTMNGLHRYPSDPDASIGGGGDTFSTMDVMAHEFGHQWLSYTYVDSAGSPSPALLGRDYQHWNFFFDADSSFMEGCDWAQVRPDSFVTDGVSSTFGALDQYLMGMRTRAEIDSFFVINAPEAFDPPGTYIPISIPETGIGCRGRATWWHISDIEAVNGPRVPDGSVAQRTFRTAFVLLTPRGSGATTADLAKLATIRDRFPRTMADATLQRCAIDVSLHSRPGAVRITHVPLASTESSTLSRVIGARVQIVGGSLGRGVDPASVRLHWRSHADDAFADQPMSPAAPDSFAVSLPPQPAGSQVQYWISAASDSGDLAAQSPPAGAAAPYAFHVGPDVTPPQITYWPLTSQSRDRLPQDLLARVTDDVAVDSVWLEYRVGAAAPQSAVSARAGADSFVVTLPAGLATGQRVAYRIVARDASSARNLAYSNAAFDTLRVTHDWADDFENPSHYAHFNGLFSWRDLWQVQSDPTQSGNAAWHCGSNDGTPYAPHTDAALYSQVLYDIVPGTKLVFDQRYDLENEDATRAFDGARVEISVNNGPYAIAMPTSGYTHTMDEGGMPFAAGSPCWSGASSGWVTTTIDVGAYAPGFARVRWRMCADDLVGKDGWWVDRVRVRYPDEATLAVTPPALALQAGLAWPNPSHGLLQMTLTLPRTAAIEWTLHDLQGRRVATLWRGTRDAGHAELSARSPAALAPGLYFTRLAVDGHVLRTARVALLR
jgi:hypothetical protein